MADFEMDSLVPNHRPGLQSRSSSLTASYSRQLQDIDTHYHDSASSIALLSPEPTDIEEKVRDRMLTTEIAPAKDLDPNPRSAATDSASSSFQYRDARAWWSDWWLPEILALVFSVVCLGSIVLVLERVDGRPLSEWHSFVQGSVPGGHIMSMAPNSVISFLSTIAKSCLGFTATACISQVKWLHMQKERRSLTSLQIFDDASRGPLGAIGLFLTAETASSVAAVGALITLAALVIDPFTQLVITYPLQQVSSENGIALIYTSSIYDSGATIQLTADDISETYLNVPMLGAIYNGIYDLDLHDTPICSTGNCKWEGWVPSLAVCSKCTDVTDKVNKSCGHLSRDSMTYGSSVDPTNKTCNLTTLSGLEVSTLFHSNTSTMANNTVGVLDYNDGMTLLWMASAMARNDQMNPARVSLTAPSNGSSYIVSDCTLQWCYQYDNDVQIVNGSITNRDTWLIAHRNATNSLPAIDPMANPVWNASFAHDPLPNTSNIEEPVPNFNISINHADTLCIRDYLASILGKAWAGQSFEAPWMDVTLYASQNVSLMMDHLAASMTKHIRASRNATSVPGQALTTVTYVKVHWAWLSLLIATTGMSIIFLSMVVILSHISATFLWKSNSLALLFHGLEGWSSTELDATSVATMTKMARTMDGQLKRDSDGLLKIVRS